jgi:hypothetical protein
LAFVLIEHEQDRFFVQNSGFYFYFCFGIVAFGQDIGLEWQFPLQPVGGWKLGIPGLFGCFCVLRGLCYQMARQKRIPRRIREKKAIKLNVFRLLVYAVIAAALLWFFFAYLQQFFVPPSQAIESIQQGIEQAKLVPGKTIAVGTLVFSEKTSLGSSLFSGKGTDSLLECNNPSFCCDKGIACSQKAFWNDEQMTFSNQQAIPAFIRCKTEYNFFACKVFVGSAPSQLELESVNPEKTVDLRSGSQWKASIEIQNKGSIASVPGTATVTVSKKQANGEKEVLGIRPFAFESIAPGQSALLEIAFPLAENGEFESLIHIESDNAGFAEQTVQFQAVNQPSACRALTQQPTVKEFDAPTGECIEKFFCADCMASVECEQQWQLVYPEKSFEIGDYSFVQTRETGSEQSCQ